MGVLLASNNRKGILGLPLGVLITVVVVAIAVFIVLMWLIPGIYSTVGQFLGMMDSCKDPGRPIEKYMRDVNQSLFILSGIDLNSPDGDMVEVQIDADEFVLGIDESMFDCYKAGDINGSALALYDRSLFGPRGAERKMEDIYRDYIRNLAVWGKGSLKTLKRYIKLYKERYKGGGVTCSYCDEVDSYVNVYKTRTDYSVTAKDFREEHDVTNLGRTFELTRKQFSALKAGSDPEAVFVFHQVTRNFVHLFLWDRMIELKEIDPYAYPPELRAGLSDADLLEGVEEYGRTVSYYLDTIYAVTKASEKSYGRSHLSDVKGVVKADIEEVFYTSRALAGAGETAAVSALCGEVSKTEDLDGIKRYFGVTMSCGRPS